MSESLEEALGYELGRADDNARARHAALSAGLSAKGARPTSLVSYASAGKLLIAGPHQRAIPLATRLSDSLVCTVLSDEERPADVEATSSVTFIRAKASVIAGYLGAFEVHAVQANGDAITIAPSLLTAHTRFDVVLDLSPEPLIGHAVSPPGYFAPGDDEAALESALEAIPDLKGEFEKPKYFNYAQDLCAHGRSGIAGCTRCLDACPTGAITSLGEWVEVNPYLCQGGGVCASACPTGAMTYAYPRTSDLLNGLRDTLVRYEAEGGRHPVLLFHDTDAGRVWLKANATTLPGHVIPVEVEEIGAVGLETWLCAAAYGVGALALLCLDHVPRSVRSELATQIATFTALLDGLGYGIPVSLLSGQDHADLLKAPQAKPFEPARFAAMDEKRTNFRLAIDHLHAQAPKQVAELSLPAGAPFGDILVDKDACTLCMACVSVCPAHALEDGAGEPQLNFVEWNCVQCGVCERACPEHAITRSPRLLFEDARQRPRLLNEDAPFACVSCGKPFATTAVISRMFEKLKGHWMFDDPQARARLEMCEDCRVKDMFLKEGGLPDVQRKP